ENCLRDALIAATEAGNRLWLAGRLTFLLPDVEDHRSAGTNVVDDGTSASDVVDDRAVGLVDGRMPSCNERFAGHVHCRVIGPADAVVAEGEHGVWPGADGDLLGA